MIIKKADFVISISVFLISIANKFSVKSLVVWKLVLTLNSFCNYRSPNQQRYLCIILSLQKKIEPHLFVLHIPQFIWQDLKIKFKGFNRRKKYVLKIGI